MYEMNRNRSSMKQRKKYAHLEKTRLANKIIGNMLNLSRYIKMKNMKKMTKRDKDSSSVRIRNRCIITDRGRGVVREYRINRIKFREKGEIGELMGIRKSSW